MSCSPEIAPACVRRVEPADGGIDASGGGILPCGVRQHGVTSPAVRGLPMSPAEAGTALPAARDVVMG